MKVLELFSGTGSVGKCCNALGWDVVSVDMILPADHQVDIMDFDYKQYDKDNFDIIWASPPCTNYSKLQDGWIGRMRKGEIYTKEIQEEEMKNDDKLVLKTLEIIKYFMPEYWFIENPASSKMKDRPFMKDIPFYLVDYCMYSDWGYKKRTRIWTNKKDFKPLVCNKNCGNMVGKTHKTNLGNSAQNRKTKGKGTTQQDRYRIPEDLIFSLFLD
jgi:site-specific DNA-cytosine methylase